MMNFCIYIKPWPIFSGCMSGSECLTSLSGATGWYRLGNFGTTSCMCFSSNCTHICRAPQAMSRACTARQKRTQHFKYSFAEFGCHLRLFLPRPQGLFRRGCCLGLQMWDLKNYMQKYRYDTQYTHFTQKFIFYAKIIFRL